jgi:hypothetical protein
MPLCGLKRESVLYDRRQDALVLAIVLQCKDTRKNFDRRISLT